jgi:glycosyltransferase involved in cell wall biosynthesis
MKIAFVDQPLGAFTLPPTNSVAIWIHEVARRLAAGHGHAVTVIARGSRRQPAVERAPDGVVIRRPAPARERRGLGRLARLAERSMPLGPRPYAAALYHLDYAVQAAWAARAQGCDVIHLHNFSQFAPVARAFNPRARIVLHMHCAWLTQLDRGMIARRLRAVDLIVGCCEHLTAGIRERFPEHADRCRTVFNGVTPEMAAGPRPPSANGTRRVVFVGRVSPEKGLHVLADALKRVAERWPHTHLAVVGSPRQLPLDYLLSLSDDAAVQDLAAFYDGGSEVSYYDHVRRQLEALGIADQVAFTGAVPHPQVAEYYRGADVYVQPSFSEAFPIPVPEAMAAGLPVVASDVGGIPEAVVAGQTGLLVKPGDAAALAEALLRVLSDDGLRRAMGEAARQRALSLFSWDRIAQEMAGHYQALSGQS